ncbi:MAG: hypothetical protein Q4G68_11500 [Planctomycetia bacterium]|nr:hypothetical protein [Planctomycetia bacterium]
MEKMLLFLVTVRKICLVAIAGGLLLTAGCASEVLKGQVDASRAAQDELAQELAATREHVRQQDARNEELVRVQAELEGQIQNVVASLRKETEELSRERDLLLQERDTLAQERDLLALRYEEATAPSVIRNAAWERPADLTIVPNNSEKRFRPVIEDPELLPPRFEEGKIILEISDGLLFSQPLRHESPELSEQGKARLLRIANELRRYSPTGTWRVEGHVNGPVSDASGNDRAIDVSLRKSAAAVNFLAVECGVPSNRLEIAGCGCAHNVIARSTSGVCRNDRIELIVELQ